MSATTDTARRCADCQALLSRFNPGLKCATCEARIQVGNQSFPVPARSPSRPPAPQRPVLEGAVPLPGPVPGKPAPTLEETARMMAQTRAALNGGQAVPETTTCAECGHAMPAKRHGWLCATCTPGPGVDARRAEEATVSDAPAIAEPAVSAPKRATKPARTASVVAPTRAPKPERTSSGGQALQRLPASVVDKIRAEDTKRGGRPRAFDWDEAVKLAQQHMTVEDIAERLGGSVSSVKRAIYAARAAGQTVPATQRKIVSPRRGIGKYDQAEAARIYRESGGSTAEVARQLGCSWDTARDTVAREISADERATLKRPRGRPARRKFDHTEAVRLYRETANVRQIALTLDVASEPVRRALIAALGRAEYDAIRKRVGLAAKGVSVTTLPPPPAPEPVLSTPYAVPPDRAVVLARFTAIGVELERVNAARAALADQANALLRESADLVYTLAEAGS